MPSLAEKINRLIRLSASPNLNEARNAAFQACRLLRENGIFLKEPKHKPPTHHKEEKRTMSKITLRVCDTDEAVKAVMQDYENAGFKLNETKSFQETAKLDKQTIVVERGDREVHIQLKG